MIWKLAKILKNSIACLIPFFYTAFVIISLYTSTSCDSGLEESSFFKIQTFLTESYYAVWDFRPTQEFTAYLIFLTLAILLYILGGCRSPDNKAGEHFMRFQKFCSNNQEAIFLVTVTVVFCLSLNRLNLCEAVLGLMLMGYGLAICFASHALKIPILELYFMASLLLKVGHNTFSWHYIFGGLFVFYIYSLAVMMFPSLDLENTVSSLKESQKIVTLHMVTEFKYFRSLETLLILYWGLRLTFPEGFKMVFGELHYLIMHFVYYGVLCSVLAKLVVMNLFNPLTDKKMAMLGTGAGVTSAVLGLTMLDMNLEDRAIGGSQETTPGPDTERGQFARLGYTSTTKSGLIVGKAWTDANQTQDSV